MRPIPEETEHGGERRPLVPEREEEQPRERIQHEEEHDRPHQHDGRNEDGIANLPTIHGTLTKDQPRTPARVREESKSGAA